MNSEFDLIPRPRGRGRTTNLAAAGGQPVVGTMANGLWKPGGLSDAQQLLRRPLSNDGTPGHSSVSPVDHSSKQPPLSAYTPPPSSLSPPAGAEPDAIHQRSRVSLTSPEPSDLPTKTPPRASYASAAAATSAPVARSPSTPAETSASTGGGSASAAGGTRLSAGATPFSLDAKPFSPDAKPFSPDAKPFSPEAMRFSPDAKPFSPTRGVASVGLPPAYGGLAAPVADKRLSVEAQVFVPRSRAVQLEHPQPQQLADHDSYSAGEEEMGAAACSSRQDEDNGFGVEVTPEEIAMTHLTEVMAHMTLNPGSFDKMVIPLLDAFGSWLEDEETVRAIVGALFEQSVTDANFRFNGARLCHLLNNKFGSRFRTYLLKTCSGEHKRVLASACAEPRRAHGYLLFVADLFVTLELVKGSGQRIDILGKALLEMANLLLSRPNQDNVKFVCQALKLAGYHLDQTKSDEVDAIFRRLQEICDGPEADDRVRLHVKNVTALRRDNWGISRQGAVAAPVEVPSPAAAAAASAPPAFGPVFYGPDGHILSAEERQFLQESTSSGTGLGEGDSSRDDSYWEPEDEMDDEIQAAFEQFLLYGKKQPPQQ